MDGKISPLREILPQQTVRVFVGPALPWTLRITKVHAEIGGNGKLLVLSQLHPPIPCEGPAECCGEFLDLGGEGRDDGRGVLAIDLDQQRKPGLSFHERGDMRVLRAGDQIALPMPRDGTVFHRGRAITNRAGVGYMLVASMTRK